ncbi:MAG: phage integrase N-terminal SAM-like domain-containing protein [Hyphomicrobium sp.]|jgi:site-specific recombinase XerD
MKDPAIEKPISDLRRRMLEDVAVRRFGEKTQHDYIRHIENFVKFLGRSPETATGEDLRRYQVYQVERGAQPPSMNSSTVALRFLFTFTLGRGNLAQQLTRVDIADARLARYGMHEVGDLDGRKSREGV